MKRICGIDDKNTEKVQYLVLLEKMKIYLKNA